MFFIETALIKTTLLEWFNKKIKSQHPELHILIKDQYGKKNPIDWQKDKCVICKIPLKIDPLGYDMLNPEMSYGDFLTNIYSDAEIQESPQICTLKKYYETYQKIIKIFVYYPFLVQILTKMKINSMKI